MPAMRRVVVTGVGIVSPLGLDTETTWSALLAGQSGITTLSNTEDSKLHQFAGTIKHFKLANFKTRHIHKMDPFIQYGLQAAREAILDAGLPCASLEDRRIGVNLGSGLGGLTSIEKQHKNLLNLSTSYRTSSNTVSPFFIPSMLVNMLSGLCAIEYTFRGPNFSVASACATGAHNIGLGARCIIDNDADIMIVGGAEMSSAPLSIAGFSACRVLSTRYEAPTEASRPWDINRDGLVLGDGAGILVLEEYEHAMARSAHIYGELLGFGMSADAYDITAPEPMGKGISLAMLNALSHANIQPHQVDYINPHATSTLLGDVAEIRAIKQIWGAQAKALKMSATKSMTGHLLGAAGALEAIFCLLVIRDQIIPPTINLTSPDPICSDLNLAPHRSQKSEVNITLSNASGFGGTNTALIFGKA
jgi:3-oxoacyl-[acyl-carrier-protein] synthase II